MAPAGWRAAAAAVVVFGFIVAGVSLVSPVRDGLPKSSEAVSEEPPLAPFEETIALEEIDVLLSIEDPDALENEDLLLLLFPEPGLL
jgi:hypothetical protein